MGILNTDLELAAITKEIEGVHESIDAIDHDGIESALEDINTSIQYLTDRLDELIEVMKNERNR